MTPGGQQEAQPIIIVKKKKGGHGGHHGGAWKVAYADFVTAMMALFIVLWLMNTKKEVQEAVGGYFRDPTGKGKLAGSSVAGQGEALSVSADDVGKLKEKIEGALKGLPDFELFKNNIEVTITGEGLRLELMENEKGMFFESGSGAPTPQGTSLLQKLGVELGKLPNHLMVEGHTDSRPLGRTGGYTNWELSADRANAARTLLQQNGVRADQVRQVRGFADQRLRSPERPDAATNRRVSVIIASPDIPPEQEAKRAAGAPAAKPAEEAHGSKPAAAPTAKQADGHGPEPQGGAKQQHAAHAPPAAAAAQAKPGAAGSH